MSNVLERLVAKGRRVHNVRDQREVAFGLADLSTHEELHHRIVKKGGIKTLIHLLTTSRDVEAQRFSALALANTSCAELHRVDIALQENSLMHLTEYVRNEEADIVGRQYCAMALGNLAADPENHSNIAMIGGIEALVMLLKLGANEQNLESGRFAAFSLSNLAANSNYRKQIVEEGAIEPLILLACSDDVNVQRQALAALRGICISSENRALAVEAGILDPLVLMARSENIDILREVMAALNCLSSAAENKEEVSDRAISTIIVMLLKGDRIIERHACCAIANLAEISQNHARLLDENGLPPIVAMFASDDLNCKGEAARALANLSANAEVHSQLLTEDILNPVVNALKDDEINCQRFAALCLANLATTVSSQIKIVQEGAVRCLVQLVQSSDVQLEARRYSALALANLSATVANHEVMIEDKALEALFTLSNSPDVLSQYYVACTLANMGSNAEMHNFVVQEGGIQPLISLAYNEDPDVHTHACAALRGLSATGDIKMKVVQEGGLEPISRLLLSEDMTLLREATGCLCNLSLGDENRMEMTKAGIIAPLITLMQHEDMQIASFCCACLANLAEISYCQEIIVSEGAIKACIEVMRSRYIDVQREGGRLLANLCACDLRVASDTIVETGGHHLLISYLLSRDAACQRVGAYGIGNLCTHERHRVTLKDSRVLEPLSTLVRSDDVNIEIQKFAMLAIVNLSHEVKNHSSFVEDRILQVMISFSNSDDYQIRQYAALAVTNIAKNMDLRNVITEEGGLEPVLYLARIENSKIRREVLAAIATLSFVDKNKEDICFQGGMDVIIQELKNVDGDPMLSRLAYCAIANLSERIGNMHAIVTEGAIPLLIETLNNEPTEELSEAYRALGNLATSIDYGLMIMKSKPLPRLITALTHGSCGCRRMAAMALSNLAGNSKFHEAMINANILDPLIDEFRISLDPKFDSDHETTRFCLLLTANLCSKIDNHELIIEKTLDSLVNFTRHRDIKCRQNAIITLGNLCSHLENTKKLGDSGIIPLLISFAFPPVETDNTNAQFQAIAGLRGAAVNDEMRLKLVKAGCCEPLILAAGDECAKTMDIEVRREAAAAMFNLALSKENSLLMAQSGIVSSLISLMNTDDTIAQVFAVGTLANLAEKGDAVQSRLLQDGCLLPMLRITECSGVAEETKNEVSRCLALFANVLNSHDKMMGKELERSLFELLSSNNSALCRRYASLTFANLTLSSKYHHRLTIPTSFDSLRPVLCGNDCQSHQCVAFALHNISRNVDCLDCCVNSGVAKMITHLLRLDDEFAKLHGCLALRYFTVSRLGSIQFIQSGGLQKLFHIASMSDLEQKLEAAACLRNISLEDGNKICIFKEGGISVLTNLIRSDDEQLAHQACGVLANLAEAPEIQLEMVKDGILHHLKFALRSRFTEVVREALRMLCNLSSEFACTELIVNAGSLVQLIQSLSSKEMLCRRFASMTLSNLATNRSIHPRLVEEGAIEPLFFLVSQGENEDLETRQKAFTTLTNVSASKGNHKVLLRCDIIDQSLEYLTCREPIFVSSAALCLSNLASNTMNHDLLAASKSLDRMYDFLCCEDRELKFRALAFVRGLSASKIMIDSLISPKVMKLLLQFSTIEDVEIQLEAIATICNLSLSGNIGNDPHSFLKDIQMNNLISFLCSADTVSSLFGALVIGNIASESELQGTIVNSGAMNPLIRIANIAGLESQRCIAFTLCNLCADPSNRNYLAREGGLLPIFSLGCSDNVDDAHAAISTIRALSSCEEIRELIVENGGLEPIFIAFQKFERDGLVQEALEALCWLSLAQNNKTCIVKHAKFGAIFEYTKSENACISFASLRCLSSCSETKSLHEVIVHEMNSSFIDVIVASDHQTNTNLQELLCFISNLCSNHANHLKLFKMGIIKSLFCIGSNWNTGLMKNVALSFLNISTNIGAHSEMMKMGEELIKMLFRCCRLVGYEENESATILYSCATIGCLLMTDNFYKMLLEFEVPSLLGELIQNQSEEIAFISSFALHQLVKFIEGVEASKYTGIVTSLIRMINHFKSNLAIHAVSCLRYMSVDKDIAKMMISDEVLPALGVVALNAKDEMEREIAATLCNLSLCQEGKFAIIKSPEFGCLFRLCQRTDTECSRFALGALANCAEEIELHSKFLGNGEIVQVLIKTMKHKALALKREGIRAISNILTSNKATSLFLSVEGLMSINTLMRCKDPEVQFSVALSLRKVASNIENHQLIITNEALPTMMHICRIKGNPRAVLQSITAIRDLASNRKMRLLVMDAGGITIALETISSENSSVRAVSAAVLHHLSISSIIKYPLYDNNVLEILCSQILDNLDQEDFLHHSACVLSNLAEHVKITGLLWDKKVVNAFGAMAETRFTLVHNQVARGICFMSTAIDTVDGSKESLVTKAMQIAIKLVSSDDRLVANDAATAIGNLSRDTNWQIKACELNGFEPIVDLVKRNERAEKYDLRACWTLSRLVIPERNKPFCTMNSSLIPCLIDLCSSKRGTDCLFASMALCNMSTNKASHAQVLTSGGIKVLLSLLLSSCNKTVASSIKALCNLSQSSTMRHQIVCQNGIKVLLSLINCENLECKELASMALCNLVIGREFNGAVVATNAVAILSNILHTTDLLSLQKSCALMLYNLSTDIDCQEELLPGPTLTSIVGLCKNRDKVCRRLAMMTLCNLAANDSTRQKITKNGALQASIIMMRDSCPQCRTYASICLANLASNEKTQNQAVLHGGLSALNELLSDRDITVKRSALLCLVNLAANSLNHNALLSQDMVNKIHNLWTAGENEMKIYAACSFVNLVSSDDLIDILGSLGGVVVLLNLASSSIYHCQCAAIAALRRLSETVDNRRRLNAGKILNVLNLNGTIAEVDIQREVALCLQQFSRDPIYRRAVADMNISTLLFLLESKDADTLQSSAACLAYLAEDDECRAIVLDMKPIALLVPLLEHDRTIVYREASRAVSNFLSSFEIHNDIIKNGLSSLLQICSDPDPECQYNASLACRKIVVNKRSHPLMMKYISVLTNLLSSSDLNTRKHALTTLRDLSSNSSNSRFLVKLNSVNLLVPQLENQDTYIQTTTAATLRHLSSNRDLQSRVMTEDIIVRAASAILGASEDLLSQLAGLMANLSEEDTNRIPMMKAGVIPALTVISRSSRTDVLQNVSRALAHLSARTETQLKIYQQGGMSCLISLANATNDTICQQYAATGIQLLCTSLGVRKALVKEKGLDPFLSLASHASITLQLCAATSFCLMTSEESSRLYVVTEALNTLLTLSSSSLIYIQRKATCTVANLADTLHTHEQLVNGGVVDRFKDLARISIDSIVVREVTRFFASISVNDIAKEQMADNKVLSCLMKFSRRTDTATRRYSSLAICNLSLHSKHKEKIVGHDGLLNILIFLSKSSDLEVERCAILTMAALALGASERCKEIIANTGALRTILKAMLCPETLMKQCSSLALNSLILSETNSIKIKINGIKEDLSAILSLLNQTDEQCIHNGIYAVGSMVESAEARKTLISQGCIKAVVKITPSASIEVKRACGYFFSVLSECVELHEVMASCNALECVVQLSSLVDLECQLYAAFSLVFLASNPDLQVPLVKLGSVRHLVAMMETESEPRHYAGLALLKLADNFENHIQIAEEGGIQALLKLGRSRAADEEVQYKASLTVGSLASKAVTNLPKLSRFGNSAGTSSSSIGRGASSCQKNQTSRKKFARTKK